MTGTSSKTDMPAETNYPHVARWVRDFGWIEVGHDDHSRSMVRALDIGGLIWDRDLFVSPRTTPRPAAVRW